MELIKKYRPEIVAVLCYGYAVIAALIIGIFLIRSPMFTFKIVMLVNVFFVALLASWWFIKKGGWLAATFLMSDITGTMIIAMAYFPEIRAIYPWLLILVSGIFPILLTIFWNTESKETKNETH